MPSPVRNLPAYCLVILTAVAFQSPPAASDIVLDWNQVAIQTMRADVTLPGPTYPSRAFAMFHLAIHDAVNSVERLYRPYLYDATAAPGTSVEAATAQAGHDILAAIYPDQSADLAQALTDSLSEIPDGPEKSQGVQLGAAVAAEYLKTRSVDSAYDPVDFYPDGTAPGEWRRTAPNFIDPFGQDWGRLIPFGIRSGSQFRLPPPPSVDSPEYAASFNQVKELGALDSATRTDDQTEIGVFWAYDRQGLGPPPVLYNQIVQVIAKKEGNSLHENARLFALVNMAQADGGVACWESKYYYNFWRPITGVQEGEDDGNPLTQGDSNWIPLGAPGPEDGLDFTPPFPAYPSGHATFGEATFTVLRNFYGKDDIQFSIASDELPGVTRTFSNLTQASEENGISRVYLGVHWSFDVDLGIELGEKVADHIYSNFLRPVVDGDLDGDGDCDAEDLLLFQKVWQEKF